MNFRQGQIINETGQFVLVQHRLWDGYGIRMALFFSVD